MNRVTLMRRCSSIFPKTNNINKNFISTDQPQLYSEQRILGYSCEQMFSVVSEVENYHSFVPWCKKSVIKSRKNDEQLIANLVVGFPPLFGESYSSTVTLFKPYLGMISHKKSLVTIFDHKHKIKNFIKKFDIFH